jgi:hypothetical protein
MSTMRVMAPGGVVGVERREHEVARERGVDGDLDGLLVADLADHDHVRILAEEARSALAKVRPIFACTCTWWMPRSSYSTGSSAVRMLMSGWLIG